MQNKQQTILNKSQMSTSWCPYKKNQKDRMEGYSVFYTAIYWVNYTSNVILEKNSKSFF